MIVRYRPDLAAAEPAALKRLVARSTPKAVIAAADPEQAEPVRAIVARRTITCTTPAIEEMAAFRDRWFVELREERVARFR